MTSPHTDLSTLDPTLLAAKSGRRRKRFLALSVAALAVLAVAMGVSFLGNTGATEVKVEAGKSNFVFPVATGNTLPLAVGALENTTAAAIEKEAFENSAHEKENKIKTAALPSWSPTESTAGEVAGAGDLALVNATEASLIVNVYVTNLAAMQIDYSSFAFPIKVYEATCAAKATEYCGETGHAWKVNEELSKTYLTNTEGNLSFSLKSGAGKYYDITMGTGGSFYVFSTVAADLSPSFYFTAQAT